MGTRLQTDSLTISILDEGVAYLLILSRYHQIPLSALDLVCRGHLTGNIFMAPPKSIPWHTKQSPISASDLDGGGHLPGDVLQTPANRLPFQSLVVRSLTW